jgi:CheY-like chemotaxis protein
LFLYYAHSCFLQLDDVDLTQLIQSSVVPFNPMFSDKSLKVGLELTDLDSFMTSIPGNVDLHAPHVVIQVDPFRLRQVISNLISNAIKFTPVGGQIRIVTEFCDFLPPFLTGEVGLDFNPLEQRPPSKHALGSVLLRLFVIDSGLGVPSDHIAHLFKPYVQVNARKAQNGGGTGLGLSISKSIIALHGGRLEYRAKTDNCGSTFFFEMRVPISVDTASNAVVPLSNSSTNTCHQSNLSSPARLHSPAVDLGASLTVTCSSTSTPGPTQRASVSSLMSLLPPIPFRALVVEDSQPNRKLLMSMLAVMKCQVHGVEDGQQCVDLFQQDSLDQFPFDIIFMDGRSLTNKNIRVG